MRWAEHSSGSSCYGSPWAYHESGPMTVWLPNLRKIAMQVDLVV